MFAATQTALNVFNKKSDSWTLRLDKYSFHLSGDEEKKSKALKEIVDEYNQLITNKYLNQFTKYKNRFIDHLKSQQLDRCRIVELVQESRLILHLGRASVLENIGLYSDRITGVPIIPGSALKGALSTWACWAEHYNAKDGSFRRFTDSSKERKNFYQEEARLAKLIFGDNSADGSIHAGEIVFVGGFPNETPKLGLDIVNPHYEANGSEKKKLTPNAFLCYEPGITWRFVFFARFGAPDSKTLLDQTEKWVVECLTQTGLGAKTAAGYGRFARDVEESGQPSQSAISTLTVNLRVSDYANDTVFRNRVLNKLDPGRLNQLKAEVELLKKPENKARQEELRRVLTEKQMKEICKKLSATDWFPKEWLPS